MKIHTKTLSENAGNVCIVMCMGIQDCIPISQGVPETKLMYLRVSVCRFQSEEARFDKPMIFC